MSYPLQCCCQPQASGCFSLVRRIGGFAEYSITHSTDNPMHYFVGRRYQEAQYEFTMDISGSHASCGTPFSNFASYNFTLTQNFAPLTNIPSASGNGTNVFNQPIAWDLNSFDANGFYDFYNLNGIGAYGLEKGSEMGGFAVSLYFAAFQEPNCSDQGQFSFSLSNLYQYADGCASTSGSLPCSTLCPPFTDPDTLTGTPGTAIGNITSTVFTGRFVDMDCTGDHYFAPNDGNSPCCRLYAETKVAYTASCTGSLTSELDPDIVHDSVIAGANAIDALGGIDPITGLNNWGFNDFPLDTANGLWAMDPTPYDGRLIAGQYLPNNEYILGGGDADCAPGRNCNCSVYQPPGAELPHGPEGIFQRATVPWAATWYEIGGPDTPGVDPYDTFIALFAMRATVVGNYVLATYIIMNDGSIIFDTAIDGVGNGNFRVPQANAKGLPASMYGTDADGNLTGPIGRMNCIIPGVTVATWDHTTPL